MPDTRLTGFAPSLGASSIQGNFAPVRRSSELRCKPGILIPTHWNPDIISPCGCPWASPNVSNATMLETKITDFITLSILLRQHGLICCCGAQFCDDDGSPLTDRA